MDSEVAPAVHWPIKCYCRITACSHEKPAEFRPAWLRSARFSKLARPIQRWHRRKFTCRIQYRRRRLPDRDQQFARLQNLRIAAPAQDPALHFGETGQLHFQFHTAILQIAQGLRWM